MKFKLNRKTGEWKQMKKKKKPKKLTDVQKLRQQLRERTAQNDFNLSRVADLQAKISYHERDLNNARELFENLSREKDRYYTESNQKTTRIARLERSVTSLKEGTQKILLAFDTLG